MADDLRIKQYEIFNDSKLSRLEKKKRIDELFKERMKTDPDVEILFDKWNSAFAPKFRCEKGRELAFSDASHDFDKIDIGVVNETLPPCAENKTAFNEETELTKILSYIFDTTIDPATNEILTMKGDKFPYTPASPPPSAEWDYTTPVPSWSGGKPDSEYVAYDLGGLGWNSSMSSLNRKINKISAKFVKSKGKPKAITPETLPAPVLEQTIRYAVSGIEKVYIIDDIHSTAFVENIKARATTQRDPFWCYLQTPQTIFDPAGKMTPETKPDIFKQGSNVEYGWYDIRSGDRQGAPIIPGEIGTKTILYPSADKNSAIITESKQKLMTRNDVFLTVKGPIDEPRNHVVNFFTKVADNSFAVFDSTSSAINNRNYLSTRIIDYIATNTEKLSQSLGMRTHFIAKRFGDQGQAEVGCETTIPYIKQVNGTAVPDTTNGKHLFVSKDRLAIGAALLFGAPMILHMKSGSPKDRLHNILYIHRSLMEIRTEDFRNIMDDIRKINAEITRMKTEIEELGIESFCSEQTEKFDEILLGRESTGFLEYTNLVDANIPAYIVCKNTQSIIEPFTLIEPVDKPNVSFITSLFDQAGAQIEYARVLALYRKAVDELSTAAKIVNNFGQIFKDGTVNTEVTPTASVVTTSRRGRTATTPNTMSELRTLWKPIAIKLYAHERTDNLLNAFSLQCIIQTDIPGDPNSKLDILTRNRPEIVRELGFAPTFTQTIYETPPRIEQKRYRTEEVEKFPGMGRTAAMRSPVDVIRSSGIISTRPENAWYDKLGINAYGQIVSSRLLTLRFARAMIILLYDMPELLKKDWGQIEQIINDYIYDEEENGFAPTARQIKQAGLDLIDKSELDEQLHTEIDYLYNCYKDSPFVVDEFRTKVLRILWYIQSVRDSSIKFSSKASEVLHEKPRFAGDEPGEDSIDEGRDDLDPVVVANDFVRVILGSDLGGQPSPLAPISNDDQSIRIIFTNEGHIKKSCGFYRNCILDTLKEVVVNMNLTLDSQEKSKKKTKL